MARLLVRHFPSFQTLLKAERLTGGANQETYRIDFEDASGTKSIALRRAAGGGGEASLSDENIGLHHEAVLMQAAAKHAVPTPEVIAELSPQDELGVGFLMNWLSGETRGARIARHESFADLRRALAFECGKILAKIHAIDIDAHQLGDFLPERTPESFVHATWERYKALNTPQPMLDYAAVWLLHNLPQNSRRALVHNDFRNGNLMVNEREIVAVLDWEVAHIGDPYRDLGWISTGSWRFGGDFPVGGFGTREQLFAGYSEKSGAAVNSADVRFWEVFGSFWWGVGCLMMAQQYRDGPDPSVERPGIGRRSSECQIDIVNLIIPGAVEEVAASDKKSTKLPTTDELLESVIDFLRDEVMPETAGRVNFLTRVAANSLDIVRRENSLAPDFERGEHQRLQNLLNSDGNLCDLRWQLVNDIRVEKIALDDKLLQQHLRQTTFENLTIDQPKYHGYVTATRQP